MYCVISAGRWLHQQRNCEKKESRATNVIAVRSSGSAPALTYIVPNIFSLVVTGGDVKYIPSNKICSYIW